MPADTALLNRLCCVPTPLVHKSTKKMPSLRDSKIMRSASPGIGIPGLKISSRSRLNPKVATSRFFQSRTRWQLIAWDEIPGTSERGTGSRGATIEGLRSFETLSLFNHSVDRLINGYRKRFRYAKHSRTWAWPRCQRLP